MKYILIAFVAVLATGFVSDKLLVSEKNSSAYLTSEVEKMEKEYSFKSLKQIKLTEINMKNIENAVSYSYSKEIKSINSLGLFGVFKTISCGSYIELEIMMDCEDGDGPDDDNLSKKFGWTGDSYVDGDGNVHLKFCIVNVATEFSHTNFNYAVLALGYNNSPNFGVKFTNEGDNNGNTTLFNGQDLFNVNNDGIFGMCSFSKKNVKYEMEIVGIDRKFYRTSLVFNYFDKDYLSPDFLPKISGLASYGVLGRFGRHQGYIYSDDEDAQGYDHNFNYSYIDGNGDHTLEFENISMPNMMDFGQNIRLYISEFAGNCENYF